MRKIALQHYIQQLRQRHRPPVDQKLEQVTKLSHAGASIKKSRTWSLTNKKVADLVRDKIDPMEFGHFRQIKSRGPGLRQDRSNGIWA